MPEGLKNFYKRWNIPLKEEEVLAAFKHKTMNSITVNLQRDFCLYRDKRNEYLNLIDKPIEYADILNPSPGLAQFFFNTQVFQTLDKENNFAKYAYYLQQLFCMRGSDTTKKQLLTEFKGIIAETGIPIAIKETSSSVIFYPAGAKLLDDKLVNDTLHWLQDYPEIYKHFEDALQLYQKGGNLGRNLLDNLRVSLEQLLKAILNNNAPLEKQLSNLGTFLDGKKINTEVRNMYITLIDYFTKYQNDNVKHDIGYDPKEVEFMIYLTGSFMRLLLQVK